METKIITNIKFIQYAIIVVNKTLSLNSTIEFERFQKVPFFIPHPLGHQFETMISLRLPINFKFFFIINWTTKKK